MAGESGFSPAASRASRARLVVPEFESPSTSGQEPSGRCCCLRNRTPSRIASLDSLTPWRERTSVRTDLAPSDRGGSRRPRRRRRLCLSPFPRAGRGPSRSPWERDRPDRARPSIVRDRPRRPAPAATAARVSTIGAANPSSMKQHGSEHLPGQGRGGGRGGLSGGEADRGPGRRVAQGGRHGRRGGPGRQRRGQGSGGQDDAAADQAAAELVRARASRLRTVPAGQSEPAGRLVEGQPLEVAEHDRQPERLRQAVDLVVQGLGLLAADRRLLGRLDRRLDQDANPDPGTSSRRPPRAGAGEPAGPSPSAPCGSRRRRARCPAGRDRGSRRPCGPGRGTPPGTHPRHGAGRPGSAGRRPGPSARAGARSPRTPPLRPHPSGVEAIDELPVGESGDGAAVEERLELPDDRTRCRLRHARGLPGTGWMVSPGRGDDRSMVPTPHRQPTGRRFVLIAPTRHTAGTRVHLSRIPQGGGGRRPARLVYRPDRRNGRPAPLARPPIG